MQGKVFTTGRNFFACGIVAVCTLLVGAHVARASVSITEVMYDLKGSDTDREWVEIYNDGSEDVNLTDWRFAEIEAGKQHTFLAYPESGDTILQAGAYAVVADKPDMFLADWPGFSGKIFDSSFSLKQGGETLSVRNPDGVDVDTVSYDPAVGGGGDGTSLQKSDGQWIAALPTPGATNATEGYKPPADQSDSSSTNSSGTSSGASASGTASGGTQKDISAKIDLGSVADTKTIVVGADTLFVGKAFGFDGTPMIAPRYSWTFGDGGTKEGEQVLYHYRYPGTYVVVLNVSSGKYTAAARVRLNVIAADVSIASTGTGADSFIELKNGSSYEIDLSWWRIHDGNSFFTIPKGTIILPKSTIMLPSENTGFLIGASDMLELLYPNGEIAQTYTHASSASTPPAIPVKSSAPVVPVVSVSRNVGSLAQDAVRSAPKPAVDATATTSGNLAEVIAPLNDAASAGGIGKWLFAVAGLSFVSIAAVTIGRRKETVETAADEYEILE